MPKKKEVTKKKKESTRNIKESKPVEKIPEEPKSLEQEKEPTSNQKKELYYILGGMAILLAVFLGTYYYMGSVKTIEYEGLTFTKESIGNIPLYHYFYYADVSTSQGVSLTTGDLLRKDPQQKLVNVYLRNDPRKNKVPIEGEIEFIGGKPVYLSINSQGLEECKYSSAGIATITNFLVANNFKVVGGVPDATQAKENNLKQVSCEHNPKDVVIEIQSGEESSVIKRSPLCYEVTISNCDVFNPIEKLIVKSILDAKARTS